MYGLKQSPRAWFGKFLEVVLKLGLRRCQTDHSVFYLQTGASYTILTVYLDDIVITCDDAIGITRLKPFLQKHFQTKDLGKFRYLLDIEFPRSQAGNNLSQRKYVIDLLD